MGNERFVIIRKIDGLNLSRVDLNKSSEYNNDEWKRYIKENILNPEDTIVLFDKDINEDWDKLHQYKVINDRGNVTDTRPIKHIYEFKKKVHTSKKDMTLKKKRLILDDELTNDDINIMKKELNMNELEYHKDRYPNDEFLFKLEGKKSK